jgi:hypothetical protein
MIIPTSNAATQVEALGRMNEDFMVSISLDLQTRRASFSSVTLRIGELLSVHLTVTVG